MVGGGVVSANRAVWRQERGEDVLLEQIERKTAILREMYDIIGKMKSAALKDYDAQRDRPQEDGEHKTMGIKLSEGVRLRLDKVSWKYNLGRSRKAAALLAINAGCRLLLTSEELNAHRVEDIRPLMG